MNTPLDMQVNFIAIVLVVATLDGWIVWRALGGEKPWQRGLVIKGVLIGWMLLHALIAQSGVLYDETGFPPRVLPYMLGVAVLGAVLVRSRLGKAIFLETPFWMLIGLQLFRLPLEIWLHSMANRGLIPIQMSWSGWNFDVLTGLSAPLVAWFAAKDATRYKRVIWGWNILGFMLLLVVIFIAIFSAPTSIRLFHQEPSLNFVFSAPETWIVTVLVLTAMMSHLLIFRKLRHSTAP